MSDESKVFDSLRDAVTGTSDWLNVRGQEFTPSEAGQAQDFFDAMVSFDVEPEMLQAFTGHVEMSLGCRLYLAENLPLDDLGTFLLCEEDERIIKVAKARATEANRGISSDIIILP